QRQGHLPLQPRRGQRRRQADDRPGHRGPQDREQGRLLRDRRPHRLHRSQGVQPEARRGPGDGGAELPPRYPQHRAEPHPGDLLRLRQAGGGQQDDRASGREPPRRDQSPRIDARAVLERGVLAGNPRSFVHGHLFIDPPPLSPPPVGGGGAQTPQPQQHGIPFTDLSYSCPAEYPGPPGGTPMERTPSAHGAVDPIEADLLAKAQGGNLFAFEEIVKRYQRRVYGVAYRIVRRHDVADDVAQEAFIRALKAIDSFDRSRPLGPWICRIAANLAVNPTRSPAARGTGRPQGPREAPAARPPP